jgi:hypothetical protein
MGTVAQGCGSVSLFAGAGEAIQRDAETGFHTKSGDSRGGPTILPGTDLNFGVHNVGGGCRSDAMFMWRLAD